MLLWWIGNKVKVLGKAAGMEKKQVWIWVCIFEILLSGVAAVFVIKDIKNNGIV